MNKKIENKTEKTKEMKQTAPVDVEKVTSIFNLQNQISKLNIYVPFNELLRNNEYKDTIIRMFKGQG